MGSIAIHPIRDRLQMMWLSAMLTYNLVVLIYAQAIVQRCETGCIVHTCHNADLDGILIASACFAHDGSSRLLFRTFLEQGRPRQGLVGH